LEEGERIWGKCDVENVDKLGGNSESLE